MKTKKEETAETPELDQDSVRQAVIAQAKSALLVEEQANIQAGLAEINAILARRGLTLVPVITHIGERTRATVELVTRPAER